MYWKRLSCPQINLKIENANFNVKRRENNVTGLYFAEYIHLTHATVWYLISNQVLVSGLCNLYYCLILYLLGIVELTNYCFTKCILVSFTALLVLSQGFITQIFCQTPFPNQRTQFRITSSEMKLTVSAGVSADQFLLNDHKWMSSAEVLYINWFGTYLLRILYHSLCYSDNFHFKNESILK